MTDIHDRDIEFDGSVTAEAFLTRLDSLIIYRDVLSGDVFSAFTKLLEAVSTGNTRECSTYYFKLTAALVSATPRRVSGNIFSDYILHTIVESETCFSRMAARGFLDEFIYTAMTNDLKILLELAHKPDSRLQTLFERMLHPVPKRKYGEDKISLMADAAWGGAVNRPIKPPPEPVQPNTVVPSEACVFVPSITFQYGDFYLRDSFVSDAALEEIYIRCLDSSRDPKELTEDLWNFFNSYGTGIFLKSRGFYLSDNELLPLPERAYSRQYSMSLCEGTLSSSVQNVIDFMCGDRAENTLIIGGRGTGKTTLAFFVMSELPEVRLVYMRAEQAKKSLRSVFDTISREPLKFLVVIDDVEDIEALHTIEALLMGGAAQPENTLLYAITENNLVSSMFPNRETLENPKLDDFAEFIRAELSKRGMEFEYSDIHNACMDYQLETRLPFSYAAEWPIIQRLRDLTKES